MNIKSMRIRSYRSFAVDEQVPPEAAERYRTLKAYERLRSAGCREAVALEQFGISRRTLYRWRGVNAKQKCPLFGSGNPRGHEG